MPTESHIPAGIERVPGYSLANALRLILDRSGCETSLDDVRAALADPWLFCAVPAEQDLARWPLYARDRHLVTAGRLFGLTIRAIHPSEAARGLADVGEFRQHFDASYRPLILRALEHDQPVLAWGGWSQHWDAVWGLIRRPSSDGAGFVGSIAVESSPTLRGDGPNKSGEGTTIALARPPMQVYIVERVQSRRPDPTELLGMALAHARAALTNGALQAFGVLVGRTAWCHWLDRIRGTDPTTYCADGLSALAEGHALLAQAVVEGYRSAERFLARHRASAGAHPGCDPAEVPFGRASPWRSSPAFVEAWRRACQLVVTYLSDSLDVDAVAEAMTSLRGRRGLMDQVETARDAAEAMRQVLATSGGDA